MATYNIGPGALQSSNGSGSSSFLLSAAEWLAIQVYVNDALSLPTTDDAFRKSLGSAAPTDLTNFEPLIACYKDINSHCSDWQNTIFPTTVTLASDIYAYSQKASIYYAAINKEAQILVNDPNNADAQAALKAIIQNLATQASTYQGNANHVAAQITTFANNTSADRSTLLGPDGTGTTQGLVKKYNDEYGSTSTEVKNLTDQLNSETTLLKTDTDEYNHDVIVAATTPTYAWIWPVGTIAAAIVAGIYGKRATDALDRMHADQDQINNLNAQLQADANLILNLNIAHTGMTQIASELTNALPIIQKIEGIWGAIANDLTSIGGIIQNDIAQALPIIMNLGVTEAIQAWQSVGNEANDYRVNAYITVNDNHSQA